MSSPRPPQNNQRADMLSALLDSSRQANAQKTGQEILLSAQPAEHEADRTARIARENATHASQLQKETVLFWFGIVLLIGAIGLSLWLFLSSSSSDARQGFGANLLIAILGGIAGYMWQKK